MTTLAFAAGRGAELPGTLSVISIDMGDFAEFNWTKISFVDKPATRQLVRRLDFSVPGVTDATKGVADQVTKGVGSVVDGAGDNLGDVKDIVEKLIMKVLAKIEGQVNEWGLRVVRKLNELGISQRYSLHVTKWCKVPRAVDYSNNTTRFSTGERNCTSLFDDGTTRDFDPVANGGKIFGFSPGDLIANVTGIFLVPKDVQQKIREPIDKGANAAQKEITGATNSLRRGVMLFTFGPTMIVFAVACGCSWLLLIGLLGDVVYGFAVAKKKNYPEGQRSLIHNVKPAKTYFLVVAGVLMYALLIGSVIVSAVSLLTGVVNIMTQAIHIRIGGGSGLVLMSWVSFALVLFARLVLSEQVKDADASNRIEMKQKYSANPAASPEMSNHHLPDKDYHYGHE
ncbi:hypothetical protein PG984_015098 [Apiospora sp. TS-2023a]